MEGFRGLEGDDVRLTSWGHHSFRGSDQIGLVQNDINA